ncbi:MAG: hypothetical protein HYZ44_14660 [Bacteroidetes bacterium]|nr:hypothetical protein [Bacteroidota bacterium]
MRLFYFLLILAILGCSKKTTEKEEVSTAINIDTLSLKMYLDSPVDFDSLSTIKNECFLLGTYGIRARERYKCCYVLDMDTLATITFSKFKTDSTWRLGINGYQVEEFQCKDNRIPFRLGLGIGKNLTDFERQFGRFEMKETGVYSKSFIIEKEEIQLTIKTDHDQVTGILINALKKRYSP